MMRLGQLRLQSVLILFVLASKSWATEQIRDWEISCESKGACTLSQVILDPDRNFLAMSRVQKSPTGANLEIIVPEGVHFPTGMWVATGHAQPRVLDWISCDRGFCVATAELSEDELTIWKQGMEAEMRYRPGLGQDVIEFPISLLGLTKALEVSSKHEDANQ